MKSNNYIVDKSSVFKLFLFLNFDRRLKYHFSDWNKRMACQQKQKEFYESAMRKKRQIKRLRIKESLDLYTK